MFEMIYKVNYEIFVKYSEIQPINNLLRMAIYEENQKSKSSEFT